MREALIENGKPEFAAVGRDPRQLVLIPPAEKAESPHDIELPGVQQVQGEAAGLVYHVVAVIEFVDVDREPRHAGHDRRAHRGIGNHPVLLALALRRKRDDRRGQIAQEVVGEVRLERTSRYMATASLPQRVLAHIRERRLFAEPGEALVAVAGAADSVALLDTRRDIGDALGLSLVVAHVDHGISVGSRAVGRMVGDLASEYRLPFETVELNLGSDATETEARRARYGWLRDVQQRRGAKYLVTAHHQDDQVETILLRALRGSAPAGLAGMSAKSRGGLVRPLLPFTRNELLEYARVRGLAVHDDPANRDPRHLRSWLRTTVLPLLTERLGPRLSQDLRSLGRHAPRERRAWQQVLDLVTNFGFLVG